MTILEKLSFCIVIGKISHSIFRGGDIVGPGHCSSKVGRPPAPQHGLYRFGILVFSLYCFISPSFVFITNKKDCITVYVLEYQFR